MASRIDDLELAHVRPRQGRNDAGGPVTLLMVGRLEHFKGFRLVIDVLAANDNF